MATDSVDHDADEPRKVPYHSLPNFSCTPKIKQRRRPRSNHATPMCIATSDEARHHNRLKHDKVKRYVEATFSDNIHWDFDVEQFISAVWHFKRQDIPLLPVCSDTKMGRPHGYRLSYDDVKRYRAASERASFAHVGSMINSLIGQVYGCAGPNLDVVPVMEPIGTTRWQCRRRPTLTSLKETSVKDDCAASKPTLMWIIVEDFERDLEREFQMMQIEVKKKIKKGKAARGVTDGNNNLPTHLNEPAVINSKRRQRSVQDEDSEGDHPRKRARIDDGTPVRLRMTDHEVQSAEYINEMMSHGIRSYGSGILIHEDKMRLWYADRMGIVVTKAFDFLDTHRDRFLLAIAAIADADMYTMGILPNLRLPPISISFGSYDGATLVLDRTLCNFPEDSIATSNQLETPGTTRGEPEHGADSELVFNLDVNDRRRVYTEFGTIGRGTTVVPLKATGLAETLCGSEDLVAKIAWLSRHREGEDTIVKAVRVQLAKKKPRYLKHVVDLKCALTRTPEQMNLPRVAMGVPGYEEPVCRTMILKRYDALEGVESVEEFKSVFVDVVRAHHWVWKTSQILHRDISTNNIMFYREDGRILGVLCDWDLAKAAESLDGLYDAQDDEAQPDLLVLPVDAGGNVDEEKANSMENDDDDSKSQSHSTQQRPRYRTGTGPFMAIELLVEDRPPVHLYRHDLESFFFVLVYTCAVFKPEEHKFGHLAAWAGPNLADIGSRKQKFLTKPAVVRATFKNAHREYRPLINSWIDCLSEVFSEINDLTCQITSRRYTRAIRSKKGDKKAVANLNARISTLVRQREELISYERFMDILGMDIDVMD